MAVALDNLGGNIHADATRAPGVGRCVVVDYLGDLVATGGDVLVLACTRHVVAADVDEAAVELEASRCDVVLVIRETVTMRTRH